MKKWMFALLCALLAVMLPLSALAAPGDMIMACGDAGQAIEQNISSFCVIGDTIYMIPYSAEKLYTHSLGDAEPKAYDFEAEDELGYNQYLNNTLLSDGERLLCLSLLVDYSGDDNVTTASVYELSLNGDHVEKTLLLEPDWEFMREEDGYYSYPDKLLALKDCLLIGVYDNHGDRVIFRLNWDDGATTQLELGAMSAMAPYVDGKALIETFDYNQAEQVQFWTYDPATDAAEMLSEIPVEEYVTFEGLACDVQSGQVYFVRNGEIYPLDVLTGEVGEAIADMPLDVYSTTGARVSESGYYIYAYYSAYIMRNLHSESSATTKLKVLDYSWAGIENAYYDFVNAHSDVSVVLSHDSFSSEVGSNNSTSSSVIDSMMNRDSTVDVYIMSASDSAYEAVRNRGYMASFLPNETLAALAERMDPGLLEQLSANGEFAALPVQFYFWLPRVNEKALEKLGLTMDDVPRNWMDFMDFLLEIQETWPQDGSVMLLDPWTSRQYARQSLFDHIFKSYQLALKVDPNSIDTAVITKILQKLEQVDFARLGQPDESVFEDGDYDPAYDEDSTLLNCNSGMQLNGITRYDTPLAMSLTADLPAYVPMESYVAFVNPYSENVELALEFVACICERLSDPVRYCLCPDLNDPTPNPYYEQNVKYAEENLAAMEKQLAEAEEVDRQMLEEQVADAKTYLESCQNNLYDISEEDIAWLRANGDHLTIEGNDWLYSDDSGEAWELVQQYSEGRIDAERLMKEIGNKIRMMLMEGY